MAVVGMEDINKKEVYGEKVKKENVTEDLL